MEKSENMAADDIIAKGNAFKEEGRYEEALAAYEQATEIDPDNAAAWYQKGCTLDEMGDYGGAVRAYSRSLECDSDDISAWHSLGIALINLGQYEEALEAYEKYVWTQSMPPSGITKDVHWLNLVYMKRL